MAAGRVVEVDCGRIADRASFHAASSDPDEPVSGFPAGPSHLGKLRGELPP
ncbi:MAG TPA: hypothetical protein VE891_13615 [Allosphingosinicella sp.]|nr:hypothetical protein [Allosphingosinicella sp.]